MWYWGEQFLLTAVHYEGHSKCMLTQCLVVRRLVWGLVLVSGLEVVALIC